MEFVNLEVNVRPIKVGYDKKKLLITYSIGSHFIHGPWELISN